jgi:hypothetical protein
MRWMQSVFLWDKKKPRPKPGFQLNGRVCRVVAVRLRAPCPHPNPLPRPEGSHLGWQAGEGAKSERPNPSPACGRRWPEGPDEGTREGVSGSCDADAPPGALTPTLSRKRERERKAVPGSSPACGRRWPEGPDEGARVRRLLHEASAPPDQNVMLQLSIRPISIDARSLTRSFQVPFSGSLDRFLL